MKTEDFKDHLRSSERCGALHQMGELEAKIKTQEKQLKATKEELRMLRQKYKKVLNVTTNSPPSQESPSAEGEHDIPEDEAEAPKEVFQGTGGEEESTGSIELNKEGKEAVEESVAAKRAEASRREEKIQDEEGDLEEDLDNPSDDSKEGVSNSRSPSATPSRSRSWSRSRSRSRSWESSASDDEEHSARVSQPHLIRLAEEMERE